MSISSQQIKQENSLIVFYSLTEHTTWLAGQIAAATNIPAVRVDTVIPYSRIDGERVMAAVTQAKQAHRYPELESNPELHTEVQNVLVGYPIWGGDVAYPMEAWLKQHPMGKRRLIPFNTSSYQQAGVSLPTLKRLAPEAQLASELVAGQDEVATDVILQWFDQVASDLEKNDKCRREREW